jgi:hypothetical protein
VTICHNYICLVGNSHIVLGIRDCWLPSKLSGKVALHMQCMPWILASRYDTTLAIKQQRQPALKMDHPFVTTVYYGLCCFKKKPSVVEGTGAFTNGPSHVSGNFLPFKKEVFVPLQPGSAVFLLCNREKIPFAKESRSHDTGHWHVSCEREFSSLQGKVSFTLQPSSAVFPLLQRNPVHMTRAIASQ